MHCDVVPSSALIGTSESTQRGWKFLPCKGNVRAAMVKGVGDKTRRGTVRFWHFLAVSFSFQHSTASKGLPFHFTATCDKPHL